MAPGPLTSISHRVVLDSFYRSAFGDQSLLRRDHQMTIDERVEAVAGKSRFPLRFARGRVHARQEARCVSIDVAIVEDGYVVRVADGLAVPTG